MSFFDLSHVTDVPQQGSLGPPVGLGEMISQSFQQQFRVDSARALDEELRNRWLESLRLANLSAGPTIDPVGNTNAYRTFAKHVSGQPLEAVGWGLLGKQDPLDPIREMIIANDRIKELNNPNIKSFEQILAEVAEMQKEVEETTGSMYERTGTGGFMASLLGSIGGSFTTRDPLNIITAPIGAGRTIATRIATDMALAAGVTGLTEIMEVAPARAIVGLPERDPLFNIAAATIGAGAIRGGIEGIGYGVSRIRNPVEDIDFDARDSQLAQMFAENSEKPSARAGAMILDDATFIERNNPFGESRAAQERFIAELTQVQKAMNGEPMTAVGRVLPPLPFDYIKKAADFEIVREQAPDVWARMEVAQAKVVQETAPVTLREFNITENSRRLLYHSPTIEKEIEIFLRLEEDGTAYLDINPIDLEISNRLGVAEIRKVKNALEELYPQITRFAGDRVSGAGVGRTQVVAARRKANAEYQSAYRAVEAEAARLNTLATKAQDAQQAEASNILAQAYGRPFIGPLLRHNNVEALVERINKYNETLDEDTLALFARQEGAADLETENIVRGTNGEPVTFYHGTAASFEGLPSKTGRLQHFSTDPKHAEKYATNFTGKQVEGSRIYSVHLKAKNIGDFRNPEHVAAVRQILISEVDKTGRTFSEDDFKAGDWGIWERKDIMDEMGWDAVWATEITDGGRALNIAVRSPEQVVPPAETWNTPQGIDIGLRDPVDPEFRFATDEGEMTVEAAMRDLQDDADLVEAIRVCSI